MRKTDGSIELNKQRHVWCLLFLPLCRFACLWQKRKAHFPCLHSVWFPSVHPASLLFVYMSVYAFQPPNNVVCLCRSQSAFVYHTDWVSGCTRRLPSEIWMFSPVLALFFFITPPFLWHTLILWERWKDERSVRGWSRDERAGHLFFSLLNPPLWSMWQFFLKVREQSPSWGEEVKLPLALYFISFPLRFTAVSRSTPLHKNPQAAMESEARTHKHMHAWAVATVSTLLSLKQGDTGRQDDELWNESMIDPESSRRFKHLLLKFCSIKGLTTGFFSVKEPQNIFKPLSLITCWIVCHMG